MLMALMQAFDSFLDFTKPVDMYVKDNVFRNFRFFSRFYETSYTQEDKHQRAIQLSILF